MQRFLKHTAILTAAAVCCTGLAAGAQNFTTPIPIDPDTLCNTKPLLLEQKQDKDTLLSPEGTVIVPPVYDEILTSGDGIIVKQNGAYGLFSDTGICILAPIWKAIAVGSENILLIDKNGKFGFADFTGKIIIPPQYDYAEPFADGFAKVQKNGDFSFINQNGKLLIPWQKKEIETADGLYFTYRENGRSTVLDSEGKTILPPLYENMVLFRNGSAPAMQADGLYGLIDTDGNELLPFAYRELRYIGNGVYLALKDGTQGYFDTAGNPIGDFKWEPSNRGPWADSLLTVELHEKFGFMNAKGTLVQSPIYDNFIPSLDGRGPIIVEKDGKYGLLDTDGSQILAPTLVLDKNGISGFENGFATVRKNGWEGILDKRGNLVIRPEYDRAKAYEAWFYLQDGNGAVLAHQQQRLEPLNNDILTAPLAADKVQALVGLGIIQGDTSGDLLLDETVTRAQFVTMLSRLEQWELSQTESTGFTDVPDGHWAQDAINHAATLGIINGMGDGTFQPDGAVTTQQIFTMLVRLAGQDSQAQAIIAAGGNGYADTAWNLGIGTTEVGWSLSTPAPREMAACFLYDFLQLKRHL